MGTLAKLMSSQGETMQAQVEALTGEEVLAAGQLRQGRAPSMMAMVTGTALIEVLRPALEVAAERLHARRHPNRVVAFACVGVADDEYGENFRVVVREKERGSWPREAVAIEGLRDESENDGWLTLGGERVPVCRPNYVEDPETDALVEMLGR